MKLRRQIRHLYESLRFQVTRTLQNGHDHQPFVIRGVGCMLCQLLERGDHSFAALQLAREQGLAREWLPAERELFELIGEKAFKAKVARDLEMVKNMPKKACEYCGGRPILFMSTKEVAYFILNHTQPQYAYKCGECGNRIIITLEDIPEQLIKAVRKKMAAMHKRKIKAGHLKVKKLAQNNPYLTLEQVLHNMPAPSPPPPAEPPD